MKGKVLLLIALFLNFVVSAQDILDRTYYFVNGDELTGIEQQGDRLYVFKCDTAFQCSGELKRTYRIRRAKQQGNFVLLDVERMDPVSGKDIHPAERFRLMGFIIEGNDRLRFINEAISVTREIMAEIPFEMNYLKGKFGFTYYTKNYLTTLDTSYQLDREEADRIISDIRQNDEAVLYYNQTVTGDTYNIAIAAELLTIELIKRGLSPLEGKNKLEKALLEKKN